MGIYWLCVVAIFYPFRQFCEINISLLSLQTQPNTAPNLFQRGVDYGKYGEVATPLRCPPFVLTPYGSCQSGVKLHPVSVRRFPSFRTQPLENLSRYLWTRRFLSNPAPGENLLSGNLVMETGCMCSDRAKIVWYSRHNCVVSVARCTYSKKHGQHLRCSWRFCNKATNACPDPVWEPSNSIWGIC